MVTFKQVQATLDAAAAAYHVLELEGGVRLVATQRGARLLGPFLDDASPALFWLNPVLADPAAYQAFVAAGEWNMGGERVWVAPEIQYNIRDRGDFWGTHHIPAALDPGQYNLLARAGRVTFQQQIALPGYNIGAGTVHLDVARSVQAVANPLRHAPDADEWLAGVRYAGYAQTVTLRILGGDPLLAEAWNLVQLNAGGTLTIPTHGSAQATPYFGDPTADALRVHDGAYRIGLTGQQQYKTGYKATALTGRMAYLNQHADGTHYLLVRHFNNDPSNLYVEEPPDRAGERGHSVHVYNDGGQFGGNAEMEANGGTIGGDTGRDETHETFTLWLFVSAQRAALQKIGGLLLGVAL